MYFQVEKWGLKAGIWQPRFFSARGKAEGRNGSRLPFACLRPPFFIAKIQNYANWFFQVFFCNVTGKKVKQITFFNFFVTPPKQLRKQPTGGPRSTRIRFTRNSPTAVFPKVLIPCTTRHITRPTRFF